ncbi:hypothetical protein HanXRQr2_Chr09g0377681 [Helianthus annuus]|uniref:Uncharacterized protein n=1 Tax=Helianthus annuus TaxID=4232 RepID=A0A9K3N860_HELAN|nr:hypothetical protein HanXRQr2_Chr09g0377681 [Helianthus annuus]KAJ0959576.1 hypothetical protein HanPSC8_Chr00c021g0802361 [Helianthus annuus]
MQESAKICNASSISIPHSYSDYILKGGDNTSSYFFLNDIRRSRQFP